MFSEKSFERDGNSFQDRRNVGQSLESTTAFRELERNLSISFQQIEDYTVVMLLRASNSESNMITAAQARLDIREDLVPLYQRTMNALTMSMCDGERLTPLKRKNENEPPHDAKRKKDWDNMGRADETSEIMNVRDTAAGMDFLENGLVRCQACDFEWDGDAQHECTKDGDAADINMKL